MEFVQNNLNEEISLTIVAKVAGMEPKYFSAFFHKKVGIPFKYWLQSSRIIHALPLLKAYNLSITEVALTNGFNDLRTFERNFKRIQNMTAQEYRKMWKEKET